MINLLPWIFGFGGMVILVERMAPRTPVPAPCWMLVIGLLYGQIGADRAAWPLPEVSPDVLFYGLLPLLLFASARRIPWRSAVFVSVPAGLMATVGMAMTTAALGLGMAWLLKLDLLPSLLLGAAVAGTDPVAIGALLHRGGVPTRLGHLLEMESMLNDGTTVVVFAFLGAILFQRPSFVASHPGVGLLLLLAGGIVMGCAVGAVAHLALRRWRLAEDPFTRLLLPPLLAGMTFLVADHLLHVSGVIAVVAMAITLSALQRTQQPAIDESAQRSAEVEDVAWDAFSRFANAFLFLSLGAMIGAHAWTLNGAVVLALILLLLGARSLATYACGAALKPTRWRLSRPWQHTLNLAGIKGAIAVALVLQLPDTFAPRQTFLCATFVLVFFTFLVNTQALRLYLRGDNPTHQGGIP